MPGGAVIEVGRGVWATIYTMYSIGLIWGKIRIWSLTQGVSWDWRETTFPGKTKVWGVTILLPWPSTEEGTVKVEPGRIVIKDHDFRPWYQYLKVEVKPHQEGRFQFEARYFQTG